MRYINTLHSIHSLIKALKVTKIIVITSQTVPHFPLGPGQPDGLSPEWSPVSQSLKKANLGFVILCIYNITTIKYETNDQLSVILTSFIIDKKSQRQHLCYQFPFGISLESLCRSVTIQNFYPIIIRIFYEGET